MLLPENSPLKKRGVSDRSRKKGKRNLKRFLVTGLFCLLLPAAFFAGQIVSAENDGISEPGLNELFNRVLYHVKNDYVDEVEAEKIWYGAIRGMLKALGDPHTRFMTASEYDELQVETRGNFSGLGIEISERDGYLVVISPIDGTPAMRAGIKPGDKIIEINKKPMKKITMAEAQKLLRGTPGTSVNLTIERTGEEEPLSFDIVREVIKVKVVESDVLPGNIGYIKLKQFSASAAADVQQSVKTLLGKKVKGIILDLRWNPGGLLDAAHKVANLFIKEGSIVSTRGRKKDLDRVFPAIPSNCIAPETPLIVLANEGSASASEIVTGALKDLKRATFIGVKTFGKGSVQHVIGLRYNTALALTIQKYYTPSGVSIHKKGIKPDLEIKLPDFDRNDRRNWREISDQKLLPEFAKKHQRYEESAVSAWKSYLKSKNLELSDYASRISLKQEIQKNQPQPLYDLEFDTQLKKAIETLSKG